MVVLLGNAPLLVGNGVQGSSKLANSVQVLHHMGMSDNQDTVNTELPEQAQSSGEVKADSDAQANLRQALSQLQLTPEQTRDDIAPTDSRDRELLEDVPPHHS